MNHKATFSLTAAVVASLAMVMSTGAQGACKTTLRGELVQAPGPRPAFPRKFLFFTLFEITQGNGASPETRFKIFQSFVIPNTRTTLPIPFALDIDLPKDCPGELELGVGTDHTDQPDRAPRLDNGDTPLTGRKTIHFEQFESMPVWGPRF